MDKKEINRINTLIALIVLIMIGIPCVYFLVNRVCYVCTIDNSFQNIFKKYEQENRDKIEKSYEKDYIVNSEGTYKKNDIKKDEILEKKNIQEFIEEIYDNKYLKEKSSNIVIARAKDVKGEVSSYTYEEDGKTKTKKRIDTEANLEILGQLKGNIKEKDIKMVLKNTGIVPKEKYIRIVSDEKLSDEEDKKYKYIEEKDIEQKVFLEEGKIYLFFLKYNSKENVYESGYPDAYIRELNKISKKRLVELIEVYNGSGKMSDEIEVRKTKGEGFEKLNKVI